MSTPSYSPGPPPRRRGPGRLGAVVAVCAVLLVLALLVAAVAVGMRFARTVAESDIASPYDDLPTPSDSVQAPYAWVYVGDLEVRVARADPCAVTTPRRATTTCAFVLDVRNPSTRSATITSANVAGLLGPGPLRVVGASLREVEVDPGQERRIDGTVPVSGTDRLAALVLDAGDASDAGDGPGVSVRIG